MKKILFISIALMFFCIPSANAGIPMPDGLRKLIEKIELYEDKLATFQKDVMETVQGVMQEITSAVAWGKEKVDKVEGAIKKTKDLYAKAEGAADTVKNAAENPSLDAAMGVAGTLGAGMMLAGDIGSKLQGREAGKAVSGTLVYTANLTYEEYQTKMKITGDMKRSDIADLYAAAFVRRMEMIDELNEEKESMDIANQQEPLQQQIPIAAEIAQRFVSMIVFEAFSGKVYLENELAGFSQTKEEDAEEKNGI